MTIEEAPYLTIELKIKRGFFSEHLFFIHSCCGELDFEKKNFCPAMLFS